MSHAAMMIPGLDRVGGAEQQAISLAKGLRRRGWRVSMVALSGSGGSAAAELEDAGIQFLSLEMRKGLADPLASPRTTRRAARAPAARRMAGALVASGSTGSAGGGHAAQFFNRRQGTALRLRLQPLADRPRNRGERGDGRVASSCRDGKRIQALGGVERH
jgi:hypothetical protein